MLSEWKFFLHSWIYEVHSKILTAFWVHSKYSGPFLWPARMFLSCYIFCKNIKGAFEVEKYQTAFEVYSKGLHSDCNSKYSYGHLHSRSNYFATDPKNKLVCSKLLIWLSLTGSSIIYEILNIDFFFFIYATLGPFLLMKPWSNV